MGHRPLPLPATRARLAACAKTTTPGMQQEQRGCREDDCRDHRNWVCAAAQTRPEMRTKSGRIACGRFTVVMALQSKPFGLPGRWPSVPVITRGDLVDLGCCARRATEQPCVESCPACHLSWVLWAASEDA